MSNGRTEGSVIATNIRLKEFTKEEIDFFNSIIDAKLALPAQLIGTKRIFNFIMLKMKVDGSDLDIVTMRAMYLHICNRLEEKGGVSGEFISVRPYKHNDYINSTKIFKFPPLKERKK